MDTHAEDSSPVKPPMRGEVEAGLHVDEPFRPRVRTIEAAALAGLVHSVCLAIALTLLLAAPGISASEREFADYFNDPDSTHGGLAVILTSFAMIGFVWFIAVIRDRIGRDEPRFFATVFFGGGILYATLTLVGVASMAAPMLLIEQGGTTPDPGVAAMARSFGVAVLAGAAPRVQALVVFSTAGIGRVTGALPKWLVVISSLFGLALTFFVTFFDPSVYGFPIWVAVVSLTLLIKPHTDLGTEHAPSADDSHQQ